MLIPADTPPVIRDALDACRPHYVAAAVLSALGNILYLTPTLFMLQIYDRVVPTSGLVTLALLSAVALWAYATLGLFEWLRSRVLVKAGVRLDRALAGPLLEAVLGSDRLGRTERSEAIRELDTFRQMMAGPIMTIIFDAPWTPVYVLAAFLLNPWLGVLTLVAGGVLMFMALGNERATTAPLQAAGELSAVTYARQTSLIAHAAQVRALGMRHALTLRSLEDRVASNALQLRASFAGGGYATLIKSVRLMLQSAALGLGAVLAIEQKISAGAIIATSLLMSRALSPIEQLTASWKPIVRARQAFGHLCRLLNTPPPQVLTLLPRPLGRVELEDLHVQAPGSDRVVLSGISFAVEPGEVVGIAGMSGAGKSTLLAALAGALPALRGAIRLDGARLEAWDAERMAEHVGYLPQDFMLFSGTVKENIARFSTETGADIAAIDAAVIAAAQATGAHDLIARLPQGYDTPVGQGGIGLSVGQTQRLALARALFGDPRILLLDEPYSHLDSDGQNALLALIRQRREQGVTIFMTTHRPDILSVASKVCVLAGGRVTKFGPLAPQGSVRSIEEKRA